MKTLDIINNWVSERSVVLDLGCGRGEILSDLISSKNIKATGVGISISIFSCKLDSRYSNRELTTRR